MLTDQLIEKLKNPDDPYYVRAKTLMEKLRQCQKNSINACEEEAEFGRRNSAETNTCTFVS